MEIKVQEKILERVFAKDLNQGSFDNCAPHIFFKVIRMEQLRGTNNGSNANQADNKNELRFCKWRRQCSFRRKSNLF